MIGIDMPLQYSSQIIGHFEIQAAQQAKRAPLNTPPAQTGTHNIQLIASLVDLIQKIKKQSKNRRNICLFIFFIFFIFFNLFIYYWLTIF